MPLDPNQRTRLLAAKARALVGDATGIEQSELRTTPFTGGAMVHVGEALWCLLDDGAIRSFGPAMVLADRESIETFHVMAESEATSGVLARRAAEFTNGPSVWRIEGRTLVAAAPAPIPVLVEPSAAARELIGMLVDAGVEVSVEHHRGYPTKHIQFDPDACPECGEHLSSEQQDTLGEGAYEDALGERADYDHERAKDRSMGL